MFGLVLLREWKKNVLTLCFDVLILSWSSVFVLREHSEIPVINLERDCSIGQVLISHWEFSDTYIECRHSVFSSLESTFTVKKKIICSVTWISCTDRECCDLRTAELHITNIKTQKRLNTTLYLSDNIKQGANLFQIFFPLLNCSQKCNEDDKCLASLSSWTGFAKHTPPRKHSIFVCLW